MRDKLCKVPKIDIKAATRLDNAAQKNWKVINYGVSNTANSLGKTCTNSSGPIGYGSIVSVMTELMKIKAKEFAKDQCQFIVDQVAENIPADMLEINRLFNQEKSSWCNEASDQA